LPGATGPCRWRAAAPAISRARAITFTSTRPEPDCSQPGRSFHYGEEVRESGEEKARRLIGEELEKLGWREADLESQPKGDAQKVRMALRLRRESTMTLGWIARALRMGTKTYLSHLLYWHGRERKPKG